MITVFENVQLSPSLQQEVKKGNLVKYHFSDPAIIGKMESLERRISNLEWPSREDNVFKKELDSIISDLDELDESCLQFNEAKLTAAGDAIGDINVKKGSIKKSLLILQNALPLSERGTYTLPVSERFDARIMDYKNQFEEVGDCLLSVKEHYELAKSWSQLFDSLTPTTPMVDPGGDNIILVFLQLGKTIVQVASLFSSNKNKRKAKNELQKVKETFPSIMAELESQLCKIDMFVSALINTKEIYEWADDEIGSFFDKTVHETHFQSGPINKSIDDKKIKVLWVSSKLLKELSEKQIMPKEASRESYLLGVCECSNNLSSIMIAKPTECYYSMV